MSLPEAKLHRWSVSVCLGVCLSLGALACTVDPRSTCEEQREIVEPDEAIGEGPSAIEVLADLNAASPATLTWRSPAILTDGEGVPEGEVEHAGQCETPLVVEVELRDADIVWVETETRDEQSCGAGALLIPVRLRFETDDGLLVLELDAGVTVSADGDVHFAVGLDGVPGSLGLSLSPALTGASAELNLEARLIDGRLHGAVVIYSDNCTEDGPCDYWARHLLATFG